MDVKTLVEITNSDFFTGVPDSQLRALCDYLIDTYGTDPRHHIIAANEGNCAAIAAGYHLSTGKFPVVYMQNSGLGNIINPLVSLLNEKVYAIPCIFIIGWRGEPGIHDEPQHIFQGRITRQLLEDLDVEYFVVDNNTSEDSIHNKMEEFQKLLEAGNDVAFIVRKGALSYEKKVAYNNHCTLLREEIIRRIVRVSEDDLVVSTTGKASRELYEIREAEEANHHRDFLTVGSMGHSSSIALGIALHKPDSRIWCIDGDGAALMHMGAMAVIAQISPDNLIHVVINNGAHESVGGMPTVAKNLNLTEIARGCGYPHVYRASNYEELEAALVKAKEQKELTFIEVTAAIGAREDLGRPTLTPIENKKMFMNH